MWLIWWVPNDNNGSISVLPRRKVDNLWLILLSEGISFQSEAVGHHRHHHLEYNLPRKSYTGISMAGSAFILPVQSSKVNTLLLLVKSSVMLNMSKPTSSNQPASFPGLEWKLLLPGILLLHIGVSTIWELQTGITRPLSVLTERSATIIHHFFSL